MTSGGWNHTPAPGAPQVCAGCGAPWPCPPVERAADTVEADLRTARAAREQRATADAGPNLAGAYGTLMEAARLVIDQLAALDVYGAERIGAELAAAMSRARQYAGIEPLAPRATFTITLPYVPPELAALAELAQDAHLDAGTHAP